MPDSTKHAPDGISADSKPCACSRPACRNVSEVPGVFVCSECGARTEARVIPPAEATDAAVRKLCAHLRIDPETVCFTAPLGSPIAYCPHCGAKVAPTIPSSTTEGER